MNLRVEEVKAKAQHIMQHPNDLFKPQRRVIARKMRKVVTGDEQKRIRDLLREKKKEPKNTKLFDKISFTLGVLNIPVCQFFMLTRPDLFWVWFGFIIPVLLIARYYYYSLLKFHYFMYDFCYFVNILSVVAMYTYDILPSLFRVCFVFTNGPLLWAVVIWRNSLVYHDFDRMTSIYIHILPAMLSVCVRWYGISEENASISLSGTDYFNASVMYLLWQSLYYYKTEVRDKAYLDANPEVVTSLRWLSTDMKNPAVRFFLKLFRKLGLFEKDEEFNSAELKTLLVFMSSQFVYTLITMLPAFLLYNAYYLHMAVISFIFTCSVYNGASYYIEVFSKRYQLKFEKKEDMQKVVQAAAELAYEATRSPRMSKMASSRSIRSIGEGAESDITSPANRINASGSRSSITRNESDRFSTRGDENQTDQQLQQEESDNENVGLEISSPARERNGKDESADVTARTDEARLDMMEDDDAFRQDRSNSEEVRNIIETATTVFVDEWQLANEENDRSDDQSIDSEFDGNSLDDESEKDKDA